MRFNHPSGRWGTWSRNAYGAFIVHSPILVGLSVLAAPWRALALAKFAMITAGSVALSFWVAGLLRKIPGSARVL